MQYARSLHMMFIYMMREYGHKQKMKFDKNSISDNSKKLTEHGNVHAYRTKPKSRLLFYKTKHLTKTTHLMS